MDGAKTKIANEKDALIRNRRFVELGQKISESSDIDPDELLVEEFASLRRIQIEHEKLQEEIKLLNKQKDFGFRKKITIIGCASIACFFCLLIGMFIGGILISDNKQKVAAIQPESPKQESLPVAPPQTEEQVAFEELVEELLPGQLRYSNDVLDRGLVLKVLNASL